MRAVIAKSQALLLALMLGLTVTATEAQEFSPFSDFQELSPPELASLQVKLTYLGPLEYPIPTLAFTSSGGTIELAVFLPFRRSGWEAEYGMDGLGAATFRVADALLQAMIDSVASLAGVTDGGVDSSGYVSFALIKTAGGTKCFESIVGQENGRQLMRKIEEAFASDAVALRRTREAACSMSLVYDDLPEDVSSQVEVHSTGFRRVSRSEVYVASMRITNISQATLLAPVTLLPRIMGMGVELLGESGITCRLGARGEAFLDLPVGAAGLAAGAFVEVSVQTRNPDNQRLEMSPAVFAGPGTR